MDGESGEKTQTHDYKTLPCTYMQCKQGNRKITLRPRCALTSPFPANR